MVSRIKKIIDYYGVSDRAFAIKCGLNQPTLFNQLNGLRQVSLPVVIAILNNCEDISAEWMMRGEGEMLKSSITSTERERIAKLNAVVETLQDVITEKNNQISDLKHQLNNK